MFGGMSRCASFQFMLYRSWKDIEKNSKKIQFPFLLFTIQKKVNGYLFTLMMLIECGWFWLHLDIRRWKMWVLTDYDHLLLYIVSYYFLLTDALIVHMISGVNFLPLRLPVHQIGIV